MNNKERKIFGDTLCSLKDNENLSENIIKYPKYLFRYKSLTIDSLADIKNNKLKFSTSNYYDDPFDTFLKINQKKLFESIDDIFKQENFLSNLEFICKQLGMEFNKNEISKKINSFDIKSFHSQIISLIRGDIRNILRSYTLSACFSENGLNETLWIKYANQHKGFALIYDLENKENYLCGKEEKFNNCSFNHFSHPLYPVYYSNKSYDATEYSKWFTTFIVLKEYVSKNDIVDDKIFKLFPKMSWEKEKITLIKKKCHRYDQEWRMISPIWYNKPISIKWRPWGIILGLNMSKDDKNLVYTVAKSAGIENILECYIDEHNKLNYRIFIEN